MECKQNINDDDIDDESDDIDDEKSDDHDDIVGFSSNDDDDDVKTESAVKIYLSSAKRALINRKTVTNKRKRHKKNDEDFNSSPAQPPQKNPGKTSSKKSNVNAGKWRFFSNDFQNSFTGELDREDDVKLDITWSDSDSEDRKYSQTETQSPQDTSQDKIPLSARQYVKEEEQIQGSIGDFDSDNELHSYTEQLVDEVSSPSISPNTPTPTRCSPEKEEESWPPRERSPSISPNTPTPTPTPCSPEKEGNIRPPLDSSKKKKQKYLRSGLAERLQQLTVKKGSQMSFWFHKTQQRNRENDDESTSTEAATVTVRVISESLDYGFYVMRCHVASQDAPFPTKEHVTVLLDSEMRKNLDTSLTSKFLRIYSPWKIFHPAGFSMPVLVCLTYCEVISPPSSVSEDVSESPPVEQPLTEVVSSMVAKQEIEGFLFGSDVEPDEDQDVERKEPGYEIENEQPRASLETAEDWNLQNSLGYQGLCTTSRVNVTARVQRIFWREVEIRNQKLNSASSLTQSIIENLKIVEMDKKMSLCCLVQGPSGVCCEARFPQDILLRRTYWHEVLCQSEGTVLSFSKLRRLEQRHRKRSRQLFSLIDSLKNLEDTTEVQNSKSLQNQQSCSMFLVDEHSSLEPLPEGKAHEGKCSFSNYPSYSCPESLSNLTSAGVCKHGRRVRVYGKLLHVSFTKDKYYETTHIRLWLSGKYLAQGRDVMGESAVSVIQVRYSSGRTVEWNESTLLPGQLLSIQDLVLDKATPAILAADIFSKIQVISPQSSRPEYEGQPRHIHEVWRRTMTTAMTDKEYACFKSLPVAGFPELNEDCMVDTLVTLEGTICDVDQENAFSWYTCSRCSGEDISEMQDNSYHCNSCSLEFSSPVTNTRLEIYLKSMSRLNVKVKLLQQTISRLLSGSEQGSGEGYNITCVLNKYLGPLCCYIAERTQDKHSKISFKLEELDSGSWIK